MYFRLPIGLALNRAFCIIVLIFLGINTKAQIEPAGPFCSGLPPQQLIAVPDSGFWGGAVDTNGYFYPSLGSANSPYIVTYTYTDTSGSLITNVIFIEVVSSPEVIINQAGPFCSGDGIQQLIATPSDGLYSSSSGAIDQQGGFNPWQGSFGNPYEINYSFLDTLTGCFGFDTLEIIVYDIPDVFIDPVFNLCPFDELVQMVAGPTSGGIWTGSVDSLGVFDPSQGEGSYPLLYTITDTISGCTNSALEVVNVLDAIEPTLVSAGPLCPEDDSLQLFGIPLLGEFGGEVDTLGIFYPSIGPGDHLVTYTTTCANCCPLTDSIYVQVFTPDTVTLSGNSPYCDLQYVDTLLALPSAGIWSGAVDSLGVFDPAVGIGTYTAIYQIVDTNDCVNSDSLELIVLPTPNVQVDSIGPFCFNDTIQQLTAQPDSGWYSWSGAVDTLGRFDPSIGTGDFEAIYTYQDSGTCAYSVTTTIMIHALPDILITQAGPFCDSDTAIQLLALPQGGVWNGDVTSDGWFNPFNGTGGSPYSADYILVDTNGCSNADTTTLVVLETPIVSIDTAGVFCVNHPIHQLTASPPGGIWGGAANADGTFDPSQGTGLFTVTYFVNNGACEDMGELEIKVDLCDGIEEKDLPQVKIAPNPSSGIFQIILEGQSKDEVEMRVIDMAGRTVQEIAPTRGASRSTIDLEKFGAGTYFLELLVGNSRSYHSLLVVP